MWNIYQKTRSTSDKIKLCEVALSTYTFIKHARDQLNFMIDVMYDVNFMIDLMYDVNFMIDLMYDVNFMIDLMYDVMYDVKNTKKPSIKITIIL